MDLAEWIARPGQIKTSDSIREVLEELMSENPKSEVADSKAEAQTVICANCGEARSLHINIRYGTPSADSSLPLQMNDVLVCRDSTFFAAP